MDFKKPWPHFTYVAFDTETSGKFPLVAEVIEIAAVKYSGGKVIDTFQSLLKPRRLLVDSNIRIHGITNEMVSEAPLMKDVLPKFNEFIGDAILIAHHAPFDLGFLALEFEDLKIPFPLSHCLDSCLLGRKLIPESVNHRLITLAQLLKINHAQAHRALADSHACLEVALHCMMRLGMESSLEKVFENQGGALRWEQFSLQDLMKDERTKCLVEGSRQQLVIEFTYDGGKNAKTPRRMTAQGIVRNSLGDYVVGLCHRDNQEKRFYLNRILSAKILD